MELACGLSNKKKVLLPEKIKKIWKETKIRLRKSKRKSKINMIMDINSLIKMGLTMLKRRRKFKMFILTMTNLLKPSALLT